MKRTPIMFMFAALTALSPQLFPGAGGHGIGFDDLAFAPTLRKVMVPGGSTGKLALIDPDSQKIEIIGGFSERAGYSSGHGEGITSSDVGRGLVYVTDRSARLLDVVDPQAKKIVATVPLASGPDYVRFVPATNEVWVTEPSAERIEIFTYLEHPYRFRLIADSSRYPEGRNRSQLGTAKRSPIYGEARLSLLISGLTRSWADGPTHAKVLGVSRSTKNAVSCSPGAMRGKLACSI
jgi:hypothetical protein